MGIFSSVKKLLFGVEAVVKNQTNEAVRKGKELAEDTRDKLSEFTENAFDKATEVGSQFIDKAEKFSSEVVDKSEDFIQKTVDKVEAFSEEKMKTEKPKPEFNLDDIVDSKIESNLDKSSIPVTESSNEASVIDKNQPVAEKVGSILNIVGTKVTETTKPLADKLGSIAENIGSKVIETSKPVTDKLVEVTEKIGEKVLDKGTNALDNMVDVAEEIGGKVLSNSEKLKQSLEKVANDVGDKVAGATNEIIEKTQDVLDKPDETMDSLTAKVKAIGDKIESQLKHKDTELSGKIGYDEHKGSTLDGHDDFFEKAARWAEGDYSRDTSPRKKEKLEPLDLPNEEDFNIDDSDIKI